MEKKTHRLIKQKDMLKKYFGDTSDSSAERHLYKRPDFPKPVEVFPGVKMRDEVEIEAFVEKLIQEAQEL